MQCVMLYNTIIYNIMYYVKYVISYRIMLYYKYNIIYKKIF